MTPRVTVQLHPDWPAAPGSEVRVIEALARDGRYRSQFETGTSNGGLTAHPGGDRWRWEARLFEGRYDAADPAQRPVYGAWDRRHDPYGASVRFGSAYLRLRPEVTDRCTFCFPDSVFDPVEVGGPDLLPRLGALADEAGLDDLDDYVEAHVHAGLQLARDVEAVVLDPCFRGSGVEAAARATGCAVAWHPGLRVRTETLPEDYRGAGPLALARRLGDVLTPDLLGAAARSGEHDAQTVKRVWHLLARFGRASSDRAVDPINQVDRMYRTPGSAAAAPSTRGGA